MVIFLLDELSYVLVDWVCVSELLFESNLLGIEVNCVRGNIHGFRRFRDEK